MMSKFKVGDRVKLISNEYGSANKVGDIGTVVCVKDQRDVARVQVEGGPLSVNWSGFSDLEFAELTWDTIKEGDRLFNDDGTSIIVLGVCGKAIFVSSDADGKRANGAVYSALELDELNFSPDQRNGSGVTTLTTSEIEAKLELTPGSLRVRHE